MLDIKSTVNGPLGNIIGLRATDSSNGNRYTFKIDEHGIMLISTNKDIKECTIPIMVNSIATYAFKGCNELESVTMGENVIEIGNSAFEDCISLKYVDIQGKVKHIQEETFKGCKMLEQLSFRYEVETVGSLAFYGCNKVELKRVR